MRLPEVNLWSCYFLSLGKLSIVIEFYRQLFHLHQLSNGEHHCKSGNELETVLCFSLSIIFYFRYIPTPKDRRHHVQRTQFGTAHGLVGANGS